MRGSEGFIWSGEGGGEVGIKNNRYIEKIFPYSLPLPILNPLFTNKTNADDNYSRSLPIVNPLFFDII